MDTRALDADLGGEIAKAEAAISGIADIWSSARSINLSAVLSLTTRPLLSIDR
jgi:hypothetical protein